MCGERGSRWNWELHVHHLTYERKGHELLEDVLVLCLSCHEEQHPGRRFRDRREQARRRNRRKASTTKTLVAKKKRRAGQWDCTGSGMNKRARRIDLEHSKAQRTRQHNADENFFPKWKR